MPRMLFSLLLVAIAIAPLTAAEKPDLAALAKTYGIEIVVAEPVLPVKMSTGVIDGAAAAKADAESFAPIFAREWSLYPPELVAKTRLKKVVFCKDLSFAKQLRTAVPDFEHDVLYLDVVRGRRDEKYVRKVIHHEFYHIIDLRDDGELYADERWARLNPPEFKYGAGGAKLQDDPTVTTSGKDVPGFLNRYAASGVEEDKAEVFAHLMVEPKAMADRAKVDKYMRAKVERMKELLAAFAPKVDAKFWDAVEKARK